MAGYGHGSVTGIDERTLGRIDLLLFDADYPSAADAVDDSWRVAVLAADPRVRADRDRARAHAVQAANARRDPSTRRVRDASSLHQALLAAALVLAVVAAGLVMPSRAGLGGSGLGLQQTMLPAGVAAVFALALLWWLEPLRAAGALWGSRLPAVLHLACAALWFLAAAVALLLRWGEIDAQQPLPVTTGLILLVTAGTLALALWHRVRRADRSGRQSGIARVTGGLTDARDGVAVFFALDEWWRVAGPAAMATGEARVRRVRIEALARLRLAGVISVVDEQFAALDPPPVRWRERRR